VQQEGSTRSRKRIRGGTGKRAKKLTGVCWLQGFIGYVRKRVGEFCCGEEEGRRERERERKEKRRELLVLLLLL
jgi:hypothetical protein